MDLEEKRKKKKAAVDAAWRAAHPERKRALSNRWNKIHVEKARASCRKYHKNVIAKKERLAGRPRPETCELCSRSGIICFDHCHESNEFRGWLCHKCNTVLGMVDDSPMLLRRLAKYLETAKKKADKCRQSKQ